MNKGSGAQLTLTAKTLCSSLVTHTGLGAPCYGPIDVSGESRGGAGGWRRTVLEPEDRDPATRPARSSAARQAPPPDRLGSRPQPLLPALLGAGRVRARAAAEPRRPAPAADAHPRGVDGQPGGAAAGRAPAR